MSEIKQLTELLGVYYDSTEDFYKEFFNYLEQGVEFYTEIPHGAGNLNRESKLIKTFLYAWECSEFNFIFPSLFSGFLNSHHDHMEFDLFDDDILEFGIGPKNRYVTLLKKDIKTIKSYKNNSYKILPKYYSQSTGKPLVKVKLFIKLYKGEQRKRQESKKENLEHEASLIIEKIKEGIKKGLHYNYQKVDRLLKIEKNKQAQDLYKEEFAPYLNHLKTLGVQIIFDYKKDNWDTITAQIESPSFLPIPYKNLSYLKVYLNTLQGLQYNFGHGSREYSFNKELKKNIEYLENSRKMKLDKLLGALIK